MNRAEIRARFRAENPEISDRVLPDATINSWLIEANLNFACAARLIQKTDTFSSIVGTSQYDLQTLLPDFYEVDEFPGGGVAYDGKRIDLTTKSELDNKFNSWRSRDNGVPKKYYRRANYLNFDRPASAVVTVTVDYAAIPDSFDNDSKTPFNELTYLAPYHYGLVLYVQGKAKMAVGKDQDKVRSMVEYEEYVKWCKRQVQGGKIGKISLIGSDFIGVGNLNSNR